MVSTPQLILCSNKNRFNRLTDTFGAALGKHVEWRKPSLTRSRQTEAAPTEIGQRESLLTPAQQQQIEQRQRSTSSVSQASVTSAKSTLTTDGKSLAEVESRYREESEMVRQAQEAVMHRPKFAVDAIGDSDDEEEEEDREGEGDGDDAVMDEVEAFLKAHGADDEGLKGEQKKVANGEFSGTLCTVKWSRELI
jgi:glycerol-3-phosphate dehydrogenase